MLPGLPTPDTCTTTTTQATSSSTTHVIGAAPHSALTGVGGQAISSPPAAAATSRAALLSSPAGGVTVTVTGGASSSSSAPKMLFSDFYKSTKSPLSRLRPQSQPIPVAADFDADLVSKDKAKQKEAVRKYLANKIRNDWEFKWPLATPSQSNGTAQSTTQEATNSPSQEGTNVETLAPSQETQSPKHDDLEEGEEEEVSENDADDDDDDDAASVYSTVSEDPAHFKPRLEWVSELSDDEVPVPLSAYRFDTPETVGQSVLATALSKRAKRRRAVREEETWNPGLACFNARRDAWTAAKTARLKPKPPPSPVSPSPSRRMSFFRFASPTSPPISPSVPLSPTATHVSGDTTVVASSDGESKDVPTKPDSALYPVETLLPLAPPLLPPANPMRASITPATYPSIYDRIVVHSMTPSCPINLSDVLRSCVAGWKRDGEWPPRPADMPTPVVAVRKKKRESNASHARTPSTGRRMSFGFLGRRESAAGDAQAAATSHDDGGSGGKGIRKSLQRVLGLGHERSASNASNTGAAA
ncbi:uncharacterized protein JN550_007237 [Neoarthrinium moseri]|uniref:uncharacterized protein n=1 Tax=Neoarthrinium moseri TaxID=1658444 RepID=UPI001FDB286D|nr:uncharacterized protein JN550_007237 [Neoarthrinium moseri]KAI1867185.1 hypothetical protein JN550_007237 [Neoarthrinium moseri]